MSFTLTLPEDNALILNAMSRALAEIAQGVPSHGTTSVGELSRTTNEPVQCDYEEIPVAVGDTPSDLDIEPTEPDGDTLLPDLDKDGLPWDNRINSTPASVTASGVWKMRRKPKDMDDDQWAKYIETVRNELTNLMSIEVGDNVVDTDNIEPVIGDSPVVDSVEVIPPPVTPDTVFGTVEPEPVAPPATAVEPVTPPPAITTFPQLMTWLTGMTGKVTVEQVNGALAEWNMNSVALLAKRPDLIPAFITKIEGLLCA